jgi:ATP-dependent Clp protease ATP-binding subunit ClpC
LSTNMKVSLIGQDKAIESVVQAIQRASVGLKDPVKPIGSFLFAGSTGTGKSLTSKILADELIKDRDNLITIDCSEYSADHEYAKLIGAPNGYTGFEQGGILTNAVLEHPFSVVVFDEIEKASSKIYQLLLQVFEEGRLTDNKGVKVSFKDTVIILTSNVGVNEINDIGKSIGFGGVAEVTPDKKEAAIEKALKKKFKPEFLNRLDEIVYFNDLNKNDYLKIIDIELFKLNDNLQSNNTKYKTLNLNFDKKIRQFIYDVGINKEYGARPLKRAIEKHISTPLAVQLLKGKVASDSTVKISTLKSEPTFKFTDKTPEPTKNMVDKEMAVLGSSDA